MQRTAADLVAALEKEFRGKASRANTGGQDLLRLSTVLKTMGDEARGLGRGHRDELDAVSSRLLAGLRDVFMLPVGDLLDVFPKLARDLAVQTGKGPGDEASILKYTYAELNKRRYDLRVRIMGLAGCGFDDEVHFSDAERLATTSWLRARANSIEGGTAEIQLNVIAKRVLGLPD